MTPRRRQYLYRLGIALLAVLVVYGIVNDQEAAVIAGLLAPLLGLADRHVPAA